MAEPLTPKEMQKIKPGEKLCVLVHDGQLDGDGVFCGFLYELIYGSIEYIEKNGHYDVSGIRSSSGLVENLSTFTYLFFKNKKDADEYSYSKLIEMSDIYKRESDKWKTAACNLNTCLN